MLAAVRQLSPSRVADAFLRSLSTRQLDLRSALGSYAVFRHIASHPAPVRGQCAICGMFARDDGDLNVLNFCGILRTPGHPSYRREFVPERSRILPARRYVDMHYPACWWRAADDLDDDALREYFGHVL